MRIFKTYILFTTLIITLLLGIWDSALARDRQTRTLVLENGLKVLLVHDAKVHRSAEALAVGVGHLYDPKNKMGLAHYLEHMLFLGTEKYPEVESFKKYLNENSGGSNAYTSGNVTNYFFQVSHEAFEGALDRHSQFFKAPLFDKKYAEREVNAVSSEHDKNTLSDGWRANYIQDLISEPGHPMGKFGTGNKDTLAGDNRPALLDFYKKYYSAKNMTLSIISNRTLDEQEALVNKYFSDLPSFPVSLPEIDPNYRKPLKDKYRLLKIKMIKDVKTLILTFPSIRFKDHQDSKPASVVASVIGHEGKGSLLSKMKEEGLVLGLSAGGGSSHPNINSFDISVSLTDLGVKEYKRVLDLVFSYLEMLKSKGIQEYTFRENQTMAQIDFDWKDPDEGMGFVAQRAALMHDYSLEDVETLPFLFRKYDPKVYKAVLETLTPENMMVVLETNSVETDKKDKYYGAEYSIQEVGGKDFDRLVHPPKVKGFEYPRENQFIPYNLALVENEPHLVRDDDLAKVWFQFDDRFKQPKVYLKLRIETPLVYKTTRHNALGKLYNAAVLEGLNEEVYPIKLAGLSYHLALVKKGVVLTVGGYSERISDLVKLVAGNLIRPKIDEQKFNDLKQAILRGLKNRKLSKAYSRGGYFSSLLWLETQHNEDDLLKEMEPLTLSEVNAFAKELYKKVYIIGSGYGNWTDEGVRTSLNTLLKETGSQALAQNERFQQRVEVLNEGEHVMFSKKVLDNNNSISYTIQIGERGIPLQARTSMVASIIESDFYTQMRTNQQLGYIVWSFNRRIEDRLFFKFIIQSATYGPFELQKRIEAWKSSTQKLFEELSDEDFEKHRQGLIVSLEKEGDSIAEVASDLYYLATEEEGDFDYKDRLIEAVKKLKKEEVQKLAQKLFLNSQTPSLAILIRSNQNKDTVPESVFVEVDQFKNRKKSAGKDKATKDL